MERVTIDFFNDYLFLHHFIEFFQMTIDPMPLLIAASIIVVAVFFAWAFVRHPVRMVKP